MSSTALHIRPIIGLEIHVQLATRTKLFCGCALEFAAEPNSRVCPVCLALPGALPVMNRRAFEFAIKAGLALSCTIPPLTKWDRKSYFYPDLPKNYQISQYDLPLAKDGHFDIHKSDGSMKSVGIIRAHLEEDAGKNIHEGLNHTRVDLNRAGTPLLEIVTQPDLADAEEAYIFCVELHRLVRYLGISEADMQKGHMRFEPNVNVAITDNGHEYRTPICEVKNLNSFRSVRGAIAYEIDRQVTAWKADHDYTLQKLGKMNYGWNDVREVTEFQRGKEESHDYRYFPDPDLAPVAIDRDWLNSLQSEVGELPSARQRRFITQYVMTEKDCEIILADRQTAEAYELAVGYGASPRTLTRHFMGIWNNIASLENTTPGRIGLPPATFADLAKTVDDGTISATAANQVAEHIYRQIRGAGHETETLAFDISSIARELGLIQERDASALQTWVDQAFAANPQAVSDALGANAKKAQVVPGFLRGQVMKISGGKADPKLAGELIERKLNELKSNP